MPELPEVETVRRSLVPVLKGQTIARATTRTPALRGPLPRGLAKALKGAKVIALRRRAKYLLIDLSTRQTLIIHLGMTGGFFVREGGKPQKHDHLVLTLQSGGVLAFHDPRRFGQIDLVATDQVDAHPSLHPLGPEPLDPPLTSQTLAAQLARRTGPIKTVLLDQHVLAGLGNIYVSEALFAARIAPTRPANSLTKRELTRLAQDIVSILTAAIDAGGSTLRDYRHPDGELGLFQDKFSVYGREGLPCPGCTCQKQGGAIKRLTQAGRSTFYCPVKQG